MKNSLFFLVCAAVLFSAFLFVTACGSEEEVPATGNESTDEPLPSDTAPEQTAAESVDDLTVDDIDGLEGELKELDW